MDADGKNITQITEQQLTPTGLRLGRPTANASHSPPPATETGRLRDIYVMDADGKNLIQITEQQRLRLASNVVARRPTHRIQL